MPPKIPCDMVFIPSILKRYKEGGYREQGLLFIGWLQSSLIFCVGAWDSCDLASPLAYRLHVNFHDIFQMEGLLAG